MINPQIDAYIQKQADWQQPILKLLRQLIHQAEPEIVEEIKWGAPTFSLQGQIVWMPSATNWIHFSFPQGKLLDTPAQGWEEEINTTSKAKRTLKFSKVEDINQSELITLIKQAVQNNKEGRKVEFATTKPGSKVFELPAEYSQILKQNNLLDKYKDRPYYQQKGWIEWIESAKTEATKQKRIAMMLSELKHNQYMPPKAERYSN